MEKSDKKQKESFTRAEVIKLLQQQINDCAEVIQESNLSEYTAKLKIMATKLIKF